MPKNKISDPITDQEIAFARLILFGTMNDRRAAEAVGLNPETAVSNFMKYLARFTQAKAGQTKAGFDSVCPHPTCVHN